MWRTAAGKVEAYRRGAGSVTAATTYYVSFVFGQAMLHADVAKTVALPAA